MAIDAGAAKLGLLVMYAFDMYAALGGKRCLTPPADKRVAEAGWDIVGWVVATDAIFHPKRTLGSADEVCYGFLARSQANRDEYVAVIRGTDGLIEWIEDAEFVPVPYLGSPGMSVEQGFWGIYEGMRLVDEGANSVGVNAAAGIADTVGTTGRVTVVGHSLGSALATYLTLELARGPLAERVSACLFASPNTGNQAFVNHFDATVDSYKLFNYLLDVVPRVPTPPLYAPLPKVTHLDPRTAEADIRVDVFCNHHIICYAAMLDFQNSPYKHVPTQDATDGACILGPRGAGRSVASLLVDAVKAVEAI